MGIYMDWSPDRDSTSNFENCDEGDSLNIYGMTTVVDNKVLTTCPFCGLVLTLPLPVEVPQLSQEITTTQPVECHQLVSPPSTIEARTVVKGNEGLKEKRKGSPKKSALPKRPKKANP